MTRSLWLELHDEFEGVGAHELNPRYDHVDGGDWDEGLRDLVKVEQERTPALFRAQSFLAVAPTRLDGHDGSHHQYDAGPVDLDALAKATWIIWWKATQSTGYTDPTFLRVWGRRQLWTHRHAYHWLSSTTDPEQQADHFLQITGDMIPGDNGMLDAEEGGITVDKCLGWCEYVEARRKRPQTIYSGLYVAGGTIWNDDRIRESKYGLRPMHLAAYIDETRLAQIMAQRKAKPFDAWQYSSNGPVPGITGRADMNRIDNREVYDLACGVVALPVPLPQPEDDMEAITFEVTDLPGIYLWAPGMPAPVPFDVPQSFTTIAPAMKAVACSAKISQEMYHRLFVVPAIDADDLAAKIAGKIVVPPLTGHISADLHDAGHITGTVG